MGKCALGLDTGSVIWVGYEDHISVFVVHVSGLARARWQSFPAQCFSKSRTRRPSIVSIPCKAGSDETRRRAFSLQKFAKFKN